MNTQSTGSASHGFWAALLLGVTWASALSTQFVAGRLEYHHHLGNPLFRASDTAREALALMAIACAIAAATCMATRRHWAATVAWLALAITAIVARSGPVYSPARVFVWYGGYRRIPEYGHLFAMAWGIIAGWSTTIFVAMRSLLRGARRPATTINRDGLVAGQTSAHPDGRLSRTTQTASVTSVRLRTTGRRRAPVR